MCAGPRIGRKLMNRREVEPWVMRNNILGPVAVMGVKVPDCNALETAIEGGKGCDGDVAEVTETHRTIPHRVMAWRPHETEGALPADGGECGLDRSAGG